MSESTLNPTLMAGLAILSQDQAITFSKYIRYVLPLDGYVFWLKTESKDIQGSLHVSVDEQMTEVENFSLNRVVFTTSTEVDVFNDVQPTEIWIGEWRDIKFAFSSRGNFYENARLYHYAGEAIYPIMETQLVDVGEELDISTLIVSNSLPAWLAIQNYTPVWLVGLNPQIQLFPSKAVPDNMCPPYGVVHIEPSTTQNLQPVPLLGVRYTHSQLATDHVRVSLFGLTNDEVMNWLDSVYQFSLDTNVIGMMTTGAVQDEKAGQVGIDVLAMQKSIQFDVSYNQQSIRDIARQLILSATATLTTKDY